MIPQLKAGDCLLYNATGLYGWAIRIHTWHDVGHVEVYRGSGVSVASRNGIGVNRYPLRLKDLAYVLRPTCELKFREADLWFETMVGTPYGWGDLFTFFGLRHDSKGIVCSPFATDWYRAAAMDPFNAEPSIRIAPFQFLLANCFTKVWDATTQKAA